MTVIDVNTGKFTGSGGNLEETVTKNNLEAAEEIVRQLRLRDIGGIIVIDFIDMVLESNRDLVLRRLVECLGRDRTRHQVAEVTSLGLVQMTRKRIGTGLLEAFSETCEHCDGRGLIIHDDPVEPKRADDEGGRGRGGRRSRGGRGRGAGGDSGGNGNGNGNGAKAVPSPKDIAAMARPPARRGRRGRPDRRRPTSSPRWSTARAETQPRPRPSRVAPGRARRARRDPRAGASRDPRAGARRASPPPSRQKPKVVTRSRRRSASRPAGPPAGRSTRAPTQPGGSPATAWSSPGLPRPSTRGRASPAAVVEHVPIKRKGSRKR